MPIRILGQPLGGNTLGALLTEELANNDWATFRAVVAFAKQSGVRYLASPLHDFLVRGGVAHVTVGLDLDGTSLEGLQDLWRVLTGRGELYVFKEGQGGPNRTFHPKVFLFEHDSAALAVIGSGNLTQGGLFMNHEVSVALSLDLSVPEEAAVLVELHAAIAPWQTPSPACVTVDGDLLQRLYDEGDLLSEVAISAGRRAAVAATRAGVAARTAGRPPIFGASGATLVPPAPPLAPPMVPAAVVVPTAAPSSATGSTRRTRAPRAPALPRQRRGAAHQTLLIHVRPHHNGEVFLSKKAVDSDPGFFGWPFSGWTVPKRVGNSPYPMATPDPQVELVVYDAAGRAVVRVPHSLNTVYYQTKSEIRITIPPEPLARIPQMSMLAMTRNPTSALDYRLEFYPPTCSLPAVQALRAKMTEELPSGGAAVRRRYGWA